MSQSPYFFFDSDRLEALAAANRERFIGAEPFQHVVIDDFLPPDVLGPIVEAFPDVDDIEWKQYGPGMTAGRQNTKLDKIGQSNEELFPPLLRHFMGQLNSSVFLRFLEKLTGFERLIPDPSYHECGLHSTGRGGRLMIHTDLDRHPFKDRRLNQVLNLILFVNPDWKEEYGGHLELRTADRKPHTRVLPVANRMCLFHTGPRSFHGHPEPLACPEGRRRNSLAIYYYTLVDEAVGKNKERQIAVRWIPTSDEDFVFQREIQDRSRDLRTRLAGRHITVPQEDFPAGVPEAWDSEWLRVEFFDFHQLDPATRAEVHGRIARARDQAGSTEEELTPFAFIVPQSEERPDDPLIVALHGDGGVSVTIPKRPDELLYLGDLPTLIRALDISPEGDAD